MDFRILFASFALVFLAELGDKTQLTALAFTTSSRSPWMVFLGTSLALVTTTALAVLFGQFLTRVLSPKVLQIASGVMFVLMGLILLVNVARKAETSPAPAEGSEISDQTRMPGGGALFNLVMSQASALEQAIIEDMEAVLAAMPGGKERDTLSRIVTEDRAHLQALEAMPKQHAGQFDADNMGLTEAAYRTITERSGEIPERHDSPAPTHDPDELRRHLGRLLHREEALADSYLAFARMAKVHAVKDAFRWLAMEDIRHAQSLCDILNPPDGPEEIT